MNLTKYLKFIIPTVIFYMAMKFFLDKDGISYFALGVLFAVSIISAFWISKYRTFPALLAAIFTISSILFLLTLGKNNFQDSYLAFSSLLFILILIGINNFFSQQEKYNRQEIINKKTLYFGFNLNQTIVLFSIFFLTGGIYGIYIDLSFPIWRALAAVFAGVSILMFYLAKINFLKNKIAKDRMVSFTDKTFAFYSCLFGFLVVEIFWAMSFSPVNHLTAGSIMLCLCYSFWSILQDRLEGKLTRKSAFLNLLFFAVAVIIILATSKWSVV
ncbi:MAG: hypothetical protein U9N04_00115 [Patescibacteria group bacterium]|nr:hypothetical protein [Patescibacteria group bacterium]